MRARSSRKSQRRTEAKSQRYEGLLQVVRREGQVSDKRWTFDRLGSHGQSRIVLRFTAPAEVKGVALLVVNHPDRASDQWMWTPAIERDRRIALQDRSTRFFGTDFSFEDLEERDVNQYDYALLGEEAIDGAPAGRSSRRRGSKSSQYTRAIVWIRKDNYAFARVESYVKDQLVRRLTYTRLPQRAGDLDGATPRDDRSPARQPDAADARQAAVQRADERRRLHAAGDPPPVTGARLRRRGWLLPALLAAALAPAVTPTGAGAQASYRGFVEAGGILYPQDARNDPRNGVADFLGRAEAFASPLPWLQLAGGVDVRINSYGHVDGSWAPDLTDRGFSRRRSRSAGCRQRCIAARSSSTSVGRSSAGGRRTSSRRRIALRHATSCA